jgi:hypothetical protein
MKMRSFIVGWVMLVAAAQISSAAPISGGLEFMGSATLDESTPGTSSEAISWSGMSVGLVSGSFTNIAQFTAVAVSPNWYFNSGPVTNFWSVGGFNFTMTFSSIYGGFGTSTLQVITRGKVSGNGFDPTVFYGLLTANNRSTGPDTFPVEFSFNVLPAPPKLSIVADGTNSVKILWPNFGSISTNLFTLQQNTDLSTTNWQAVSYPLTNWLDTNFCTVAPLTNNLYFRLSQ